MAESSHFCVLIIGDLGECGQLSLSTISAIQNTKICAMADSSGLEYLGRVNKSLLSEANLCIHPIPSHLDWVLDSEQSSDAYSVFGESKFFRLMHLKWEIILQSLEEENESNFVVFTDLDVVWSKRPMDLLHRKENDEKSFAIQKDFSPQGRKFYCPGIMFWKRDSKSVLVLKNIQSFHRKLMENGNIPDDKAINLWLENEKNFSKMVALPEFDYVIGHRILYLLLGAKAFSLRGFTAFHANYVSGLERKIRNMEYAMLSPEQIFRRISAIFRLVLDRL